MNIRALIERVDKKLFLLDPNMMSPRERDEALTAMCSRVEETARAMRNRALAAGNIRENASRDMLTPPATVAAYGERFGKLTRFGNRWIDLDEVIGIDGVPRDGCGAEVYLRSGEHMHLNAEEGRALAQYMGSAEVATSPAGLTESPHAAPQQ